MPSARQVHRERQAPREHTAATPVGDQRMPAGREIFAEGP